jgi:lysozyme family protein
MTFEQAVEIILRWEGGYVNDPRDPGGETRYGISKKSFPDLDIANLTLHQAKQIYLEQYWMPVRARELPVILRLPVFDTAVNMGVKTAIKLLQKAAYVVVDGHVGPKTIEACERFPGPVWSRFMAKRAKRYTELANFGTFGDGWLNRLFDVARASLEK